MLVQSDLILSNQSLLKQYFHIIEKSKTTMLYYITGKEISSLLEISLNTWRINYGTLIAAVDNTEISSWMMNRVTPRNKQISIPIMIKEVIVVSVLEWGIYIREI